MRVGVASYSLPDGPYYFLPCGCAQENGSGRIRTLYGMAHVAPVPPQYSGEAALHILRLTLYISASDAHTTPLPH